MPARPQTRTKISGRELYYDHHCEARLKPETCRILFVDFGWGPSVASSAKTRCLFSARLRGPAYLLCNHEVFSFRPTCTGTSHVTWVVLVKPFQSPDRKSADEKACFQVRITMGCGPFTPPLPPYSPPASLRHSSSPL